MKTIVKCLSFRWSW